MIHTILWGIILFFVYTYAPSLLSRKEMRKTIWGVSDKANEIACLWEKKPTQETMTYTVYTCEIIHACRIKQNKNKYGIVR